MNTVLNWVPQSEVHVLERFGRYHTTVDQGMYWALPLIDRIVRVDRREIDLKVMPQPSTNPDEIRTFGSSSSR